MLASRPPVRLTIPSLMPCVPQVVVTDVAAGRTWFFAADCWLDAAQPGGQTERLLHASSTDATAERRSYEVTVVTGKQANAGTHAPVFVTLHGSAGPPVTSAASAAAAGSSQASPAGKASPAPPGPASPSAAPPAAAAAAAVTQLQSSSLQQLLDADGRAPALQPGHSASFVTPPMRPLGQLRQLTLELDVAASQHQVCVFGQPACVSLFACARAGTHCQPVCHCRHPAPTRPRHGTATTCAWWTWALVRPGSSRAAHGWAVHPARTQRGSSQRCPWRRSGSCGQRPAQRRCGSCSSRRSSWRGSSSTRWTCSPLGARQRKVGAAQRRHTCTRASVHAWGGAQAGAHVHTRTRTAMEHCWRRSQGGWRRCC
jgi:hypothetical protein